MASNPFLRGASTQSRCGACNSILLSGVCLEGCRQADAVPTPHAQQVPSGKRRAPLDVPVFSEEQRRQAAANMEEDRMRVDTACATAANDAPGVKSEASAGGDAPAAGLVAGQKRAAPNSLRGAWADAPSPGRKKKQRATRQTGAVLARALCPSWPANRPAAAT